MMITVSLAHEVRTRAAGGTMYLSSVWKTVKYREVYLKAYESISHGRRELTKFFDRCETGRSHQSLNEKTPEEIYWSTLKMKDAA